MMLQGSILCRSTCNPKILQASRFFTDPLRKLVWLKDEVPVWIHHVFGPIPKDVSSYLNHPSLGLNHV